MSSRCLSFSRMFKLGFFLVVYSASNFSNLDELIHESITVLTENQSTLSDEVPPCRLSSIFRGPCTMPDFLSDIASITSKTSLFVYYRALDHRIDDTLQGRWRTLQLAGSDYNWTGEKFIWSIAELIAYFPAIFNYESRVWAFIFSPLFWSIERNIGDSTHFYQ